MCKFDFEQLHHNNINNNNDNIYCTQDANRIGIQSAGQQCQQYHYGEHDYGQLKGGYRNTILDGVWEEGREGENMIE